MTWTEVAGRLAEARTYCGSAMAWRLDDYAASQRRWSPLW